MKGRFVRLAALLLVLMSGALAALVPGPGKPVATASAAADIHWGFYVTYNPNSLVSLKANVDHLNYVSPWFYTADANGKVNGTPQPEVNALLRAKGVKNLPMIRNTATYGAFHNVLADGGKRDGIITQLRNAIIANGYDGITIDWEGVNPDDEGLITDFMAALYRTLKADGKLVAMAVPAKTRDVRTGWGGAYNYANLQPWADFFVVMAYDQHFPGGAPGPIAPLPWMNDVATYVSSTLGAAKTVWGIGLYGYDWNTSLNPRPYADPRTWGESQDLARTFNGTLQYDETNGANSLIYMNGSQRHEVWFEDKKSFDTKLNFVSTRGFAGFAIWRLGQEDPGVWSSISGLNNPASSPNNPCIPIAPISSGATEFYFPQTGHSLGGGFLTYWLNHGGLPIFGYPLTEEFAEVSPTDGKTYTVQYFERNRFEWHPENRGSDAEFQLGLLGVQFVSQRFFPVMRQMNGGDGLFFGETQHGLQGDFLQAWRAKGGLAQFGLPLSDEFPERSLTDGQVYTVQYFERARLEYHPEHDGTDNTVQLGLLGTWALKQHGCPAQ